MKPGPDGAGAVETGHTRFGLGRAEAFLTASAVSFGTLAVFGKLAYREGMNVQSLLAARFLLAGALLGVFLLVRRPPIPGWPTIAALTAMGAVGYVGQSAAYFNSLRYVPAAVTAILLYTYPAVVTVLSWPLYGARIGRWRAIALVTALVGTALVASPSGGLRTEGVLLGLASAVVYSAYILVGKRVMAGVDPVFATAVVAVSAGATYLAFGLAGRTIAAPPTALAWLWVFGIAVIATVVGAGGFLAGLRLTDPGRASLISTLEPVSTAVLAALVFSERLSAGQLLGGALVLFAVVLISRVDRAPSAPVVAPRGKHE